MGMTDWGKNKVRSGDHEPKKKEEEEQALSDCLSTSSGVNSDYIKQDKWSPQGTHNGGSGRIPSCRMSTGVQNGSRPRQLGKVKPLLFFW